MSRLLQRYTDRERMNHWVIALMFVLGLCPQLVLGVINSTVLQMVGG